MDQLTPFERALLAQLRHWRAGPQMPSHGLV